MKFKVGQRVAWGRSTENKTQKNTGEIVACGETRKVALKGLKKEHVLAYNSKRQGKGPFYLVAKDTPLFKPGLIVHSVREKNLQKAERSWEAKEAAILNREAKSHLQIALAAARFAHDMEKKTPFILAKALHKELPEIFEEPKNLLRPKKQ